MGHRFSINYGEYLTEVFNHLKKDLELDFYKEEQDAFVIHCDEISLQNFSALIEVAISYADVRVESGMLKGKEIVYENKKSEEYYKGLKGLLGSLSQDKDGNILPGKIPLPIDMKDEEVSKDWVCTYCGRRNFEDVRDEPDAYQALNVKCSIHTTRTCLRCGAVFALTDGIVTSSEEGNEKKEKYGVNQEIYNILEEPAKGMYKLLCDNGYDVNVMCGMRVTWKSYEDIDTIIRLLNDNGYSNFRVFGQVNYIHLSKIDSKDKFITICSIIDNNITEETS